MNVFLLADGWVGVVPFIVFVVYVIGSMMKGLESFKNSQQQMRKPPGRASDPRTELEEFLKSMSEDERRRREGNRPTRPPNTGPRLPGNTVKREKNRSNTRSRPVEQETVPSGPVSKRHLHSELEARHSRDLHSALESKHLESSVGQRHLPSSDLAPDPVIIAPTATVASSRGAHQPSVVRQVLRNREQLAFTFMMGELMGRPVALRDDPR